MPASGGATNLSAMGEVVGLSDLIKFIECQFVPAFEGARSLRATVDEESEPYKSKYAAADSLETLEHHAAHYLTLDQASSGLVTRCIAACQLERGLALIETDLTANGQKALEQGLEHSWPSSLASHTALQQGYNALGGLWCSREEFKTSLQYLQNAAQQYEKIRAMPQNSCNAEHHGVAALSECNSVGVEQEIVFGSTILEKLFSADVDQVEQQYTSTLYYMAQVYGYAGDKTRSASYCAATLNRQLKGTLDVNEWVQNCLQLSGYFLDGNAFALSQYCCAAVELVLLQWQQCQRQQAKQVDTAAPGTETLDQQQQQQQQQPGSCVHAHHDAGLGTEHADGLATVTDSSSSGLISTQMDGHDKDQSYKHQCASDAAIPSSKAKQQLPRAIDQAASSLARLQPVLQHLDEDVAANVQLAFAKLPLYCLVASHARYVEDKQLQFSFSTPADVPDVLCFSALPGLPQLATLKWGYDALAQDHAGALQLFKQALPWFKEALHYYKLEGWVTEHCHILFEMSNLYRCLAGFEAQPHKRCVLHRNRAKLLQGLEGQLSPTHYPGLSRSISLELGNIYREIGDIKAAAGREPDKLAAAGLSAAQHYQLFLDSFKGPDGKMPAKVEQEMEHHFISAAFCLARVLQASAGSKKDPRAQVAALEQAIHWLSTVVDYVNSNSVASHKEEAQLAQEMSGLLQQKLVLTRQLQSQLASK